MKMAADSSFSSESRFQNLTEGYSTYFPDMKEHAALEKGVTLQGHAQ